MNILCVQESFNTLLLFIKTQKIGISFSSELNYHDQKIRQTIARDIRKHWTAILTLLGLISSVIPWSPPLEIKPATRECRAETLPLSTYPHRTQVKPNQLVMVIMWPINLNVSYKLHPRSSPGPRLPKRFGNTHSHNYYNLKGQNRCPVFLYVARNCLLDFLVMVIQFTI